MCKRLAVACACLVLLISAHQALAEGGFEARADLPPLLEFNDGSVVQTRAQLERRKKEVSELLQRYFIGTFPDKAPALLSAKVLQERRGEDGSLRRRVQLTFDTPKKAAFEVRVWVPKGEGPFPILLTQPRYYQLRWAELALERGYIACLYTGRRTFPAMRAPGRISAGSILKPPGARSRRRPGLPAALSITCWLHPAAIASRRERSGSSAFRATASSR